MNGFDGCGIARIPYHSQTDKAAGSWQIYKKLGKYFFKNSLAAFCIQTDGFFFGKSKFQNKVFAHWLEKAIQKKWK